MKKIIATLILCLIFFGGGWAFHYFYPQLVSFVRGKDAQRCKLGRMLKLIKGELSEVKIIEEKDMGNYTRRLLHFRWQGVSTEAYLLVPHKGRGEMVAVLALHGHHTSKEEVIGKKSSHFGIDYGLRLVKAGFCVLAPDIPFSVNLAVEDFVAMRLIMSGAHLTGMRVSYLKALLDYLCSLPFIDPEKVGCIGWSMGGGLAMYLAAVDKRVKVVAISNYFGTYKDTFMNLRQSTDNYIPGILNFGEMADVACLITPRPLWLEGGKEDPEFPQEAFKQGIDALKKCYQGTEERLTWQLMPGGHRFEGKGLEEWFKRWL